MNKIFVGIAILLSSILIITNFAAGNGQVHIIIGWADPGMLAIIGILIGFMLGFGIKGLLMDKLKDEYSDESVDF